MIRAERGGGRDEVFTIFEERQGKQRDCCPGCDRLHGDSAGLLGGPVGVLWAIGILGMESHS